MLVGEAQGLFCERATPIGRGLLEKKYIFQVCACDEDGQEHFRNLSRLYPGLRFVYVYGWDGWNEYSYEAISAATGCLLVWLRKR
jgi:hypothetical protein